MAEKREILGSLAALHAEQAVGFVGYPQQYVKGATPEECFIHGVDVAGQPFTLAVVPPERHLQAAKESTDRIVPSVALLSDTRRTAQMPCVAMPDNSPITKTGGMILAEQVTVVDKAKGLYRSNWLSVLQESNQVQAPQLAVGYMESTFILSTSSPEIQAKKQRLIHMNAQWQAAVARKDDKPEQIEDIDILDYQAQRDSLSRELFNEAYLKWFVAVDVQYRRLQTLPMDNEAKVRSTILELIDSNTVQGMYGGVILRPVRANHDVRVVQMDSIRRMNAEFDYKNKVKKPIETAWNDFITKGGSGWLKVMKRDGYEVEVIPVQRINAGPISNAKFAKEFLKPVLPKTIKAFVDTSFYHSPHLNFANQNAYLASPIAVRKAESLEKEILLGSIHSFGKVIGNAMELDKDMNRTLELSQRVEPREFKPRAPAKTLEY
ncbi:hypothetical protein [Pseudomonas serbica]|uniref:hypothetical protein n=1 Tax=Pseudomonas serbica TaxID=2965074 RepID=UPI00237AE35D|nr:hypothetical protein [Pseudomonas serbica]